MSPPLRVLIVDDSAFARKVIRESLSRDPRLEVLDIARDGLEGLEKIRQLRPDVVTLDLVMPQLDGLGVLEALAPEDRRRVVVVSISDADSALGVEALASGAFDLVHKPTALATTRLYDLAEALVEKVVAAGAVARGESAPTRAAVPVRPSPRQSGGTDLVVVGTSTGGPQALARLLPGLPADFPVPLAVALHIPPGYTRSMAERLDKAGPLRVHEAEDGMMFRPGHVVLARGGEHMTVERTAAGLCVRLGEALPGDLFVPSVDRLFRSAAEAVGPRALALVLTGMGADGLEGARALCAAGGRVFSESEESCVVWGMPRVVVEAGLSLEEAPLAALPAKLSSWL